MVFCWIRLRVHDGRGCCYRDAGVGVMRYTAEHRGHERHDEWCIIDETWSPCGACVATGMDEYFAKEVAKAMNRREHIDWDIDPSRSSVIPVASAPTSPPPPKPRR